MFFQMEDILKRIQSLEDKSESLKSQVAEVSWISLIGLSLLKIIETLFLLWRNKVLY
jgi:hypothetical protein